MISLSQVHPWKEILQEPEKEEEEKNKEEEKEREKEKEKQKADDEKDEEKNEVEEGEDEDHNQDEDDEDKEREEEKEKPVASGDNNLHDIPDNLLTKLLAIEMETLDTEKERINQETQPGTEGEIFIMR